VVCEYPIAKFTRVQLFIPRSVGLKVPAAGLSGTLNPATISSNARNGIVDPTIVSSESTVAGILANTALGYSFPKAGSNTDISVTFLSYLRLEIGSTVRIRLPDFLGGKGCWDAALDDPAFQLRCLPATEGATDDEARECLPVSPQINSFLRRDEGGCRFTPEVRVKSETFTPPDELPINCECLDDQSVSDAARASFAARYPDSTAVLDYSYGKNCSMKWDNTETAPCSSVKGEQTGPWCCASWCFVNPLCSSSIPWEVDGAYSISFLPCQTTQQDMDECPYTDEARGGVGSLTYADASWIESRGQMVFTFNRAMQAFYTVTVVVPSVADIRLPDKGLLGNDPRITIDLLSGLLVATPVPISSIPALGTFLSTSVRVGERAAGKAVNLTVAFTPVMNIQTGEVVSLVLPGFFRADLNIITEVQLQAELGVRRQAATTFYVPVTTTPPGIFANASWNRETRVLDFVNLIDVNKETAVMIHVPSGEMRLSPAGLGLVQEPLSLFTNAAAGPVHPGLPSLVQDFPNVGALWNSRVDFRPPLMDTQLTFELSVINKMALKTGERISLTMPGFQSVVTSAGGRAVTSARVTPPLLLVTWERLSTTDPSPRFHFTATAAVPVDTTITVVIVPECMFSDSDKRCTTEEGLSFPSANKFVPSSLMLNSDASAGVVLPIPVRLVASLTRNLELGLLQVGRAHSFVGARARASIYATGRAVYDAELAIFVKQHPCACTSACVCSRFRSLLIS
jgi:hypothetical protein